MALNGSKLGKTEDPDKAEDALCSTSVENSFGMFGVSKGRTEEDKNTIKLHFNKKTV